MKQRALEMPRFTNESDEADWWASAAARSFVKRKSAEVGSKGSKPRTSGLVTAMKRRSSVQIALRLPEADLAQARKIAERKGIGYQTLLKMLVHEGLGREARRG
jgi:hypothetical protein